VERFIPRVRPLYIEWRSVVAFVLVVAIAVGGVVDYAPVQLAAALSLLGLILHVLLDIDKRLSRSPTTTWYPSFQELLIP
jgi:hypothetical protein